MGGRGFGSKSRSLPQHPPRPPVGSRAPPARRRRPPQGALGKVPQGCAIPVCPAGVRDPLGPSSPRNKAEATVLWAQAPPSGGQPAPAFPGGPVMQPAGPVQWSGEALGTHRLSVRPPGNSSPSVTGGPLSTGAPPTWSPRSPVLRAVEFKCQIRPEAPVLTCVLWSPCD